MLLKSSIRHLLQHPLASLFNVLAIAIGVGVYLAVQVANTSATAAFRAGLDLVSGKSHLEIRATAGKVDETILPKLAAIPEIAHVTPLVQGFATLEDFPGEYLRILGVDIFSNAPFQTSAITTPTDAAQDPEAFLARPGHIAITQAFAESNGFKTGDEISVQINARSTALTVAFVVAPDEDREDQKDTGAENTATMDIGWAQELFDSAGHVTSIQIILDDPNALSAATAAIEKILPPGHRVAPPASRGSQVEGMLAGFQLNLTALSMVSILVGVFLIYNTASASVVRRRKEIGILRSLGASRGKVAGLFLAEAAVLGILGALIGIPAGLYLASHLVGDVGRTISTLYILIEIGTATVPPGTLLLALAYGFGAALLGAWIPAREAARTDPAHAVSTGRSFNPRPVRAVGLFIAGIIVTFLAGLASWRALAGGAPWLSFVSCFTLVGGFSLMVPLFAKGVAKILRVLFKDSHTGRTACDNLDRSLHRSAITIAALMAAVSMMASVSIMISSFRGTMDGWIGKTIVADLFIAPAANEIIGLQSVVPDELRPWLQEQPGVTDVDTFFESEITLDDSVYTIGAIHGTPRGNLTFFGGDDETKSRVWFEPGNVIVNEAFARRTGTETGDALTLPTPKGDQPFTVVGVYYDYSDDRGQIFIARENFDKYWDAPGAHSLAVYLEPGTDPDALAKTTAERFSDSGQLSIYKNAALRDRVFAIFDQTFAVTYVLRTIAIAVAAIGVFLTLSTLVAERTREIAVYRSIGSSRGQIARTYLAEAGLAGLISGFIGIACGIGLAMVLTWVVNKAYFGWTIQFAIPWGELLIVPLWLAAVAALAGLIPSLKAATLEIAPALRTE